MNMDVAHLDTGETVFFKRQLEVILSQTYDEKYKPLKAFLAFPVTSEAPPAATEMTWRSFKQYGLAKIIADYASDFPRVDIGGTEQSRKLFEIGDSFGYSIMEIRRAMMAGFDLEARRMKTARDAIQVKMNKIAWDGVTEKNIPGFLDYPGITEYYVPATGTSTTKTWSTKTADQILVDLNGLLNAVIVGTNGIEVPTDILMPLESLRLIQTTRVSTYSDTTIYEFFKKTNPNVNIDWIPELDTAGDSSTKRFMCYVKDTNHIHFEIPMSFEIGEADKEAFSYSIPCKGTCLGIVVFYPQSVAYGDGI
jgi:hypothetical protein